MSDPVAPSPLPDGGLFAIERRLGQGRTATVYAARDRTTGAAVALKVAHGEAHEPSLLAEFAVAGAVADPHLVVPDALTRLPDGRLALVMDHVDGAALDPAALPPAARLGVALGITHAVCVLHGRGGHHGDLSPGNVLVEPGPPLRARVIDATPGDRSARVGTPGYIAPEVLRGGRQDRRADLYALGCVVTEVLTGAPLYDVPRDRLTHAHLNDTLALSPALPPPIAEALTALLARAPERRPAGAERLLAALASAAGRAPEDELRALARAIIGGDRVLGRVEARRAIGELLDDLCSGAGGVGWIAGPRGSGRTALRRWAAAEAARRRCLPTELSATDDPEQAALRAAAVDVPPSGQPLTAAWVAAAQRSPRLLLIDLDAADPLALRRLVEPLRSAAALSPLAVVVFTDEAGAGHSAVRLTPLSGPERRGIVLDRLGHDDPQAAPIAEALDVPDLQQPGQVLIALEALIEADVLVRAPGGWAVDRGRLPRSAQAAIEQALTRTPTALARCTEPERRVLSAWAVAGHPLDDDALADFTGRAGLAAAGDLEDRGLLVEGVAGLSPTRPALARLALAALDPTARAQLHRVAAERLGALNAAHPATDGLTVARRTRHRVLGGERVPVEDRIEAADALLAAGYSVTALELLDEADPTCATARARVLMAQGRTEAALKTLDAARDDPDARTARIRLLVRAGRHRAAIEAADPENDPPRLRAWIACARLWMGEKPTADADARALVKADPPVDPTTRALALHVRATVAWHGSELARAARFAERGLELAGEGDSELLADLSRTLGGVRLYQGDMEGAEAPLSRAMEIDRRLERAPELAKSLNNTGIMYYQRGDYPAARAAFEEFRLLCARLDNPVELANVANNLGVLALKLGEPARAAEACREALTVATDAGYDMMVPIATSNLGAALLASGALDEAEEMLVRAREGLTAAGIDHELMELERRWIELALARGHVDRALALAEALAADPRLAEVPIEAAQVRRLQAECAMRQGEMQAARALAEDAIGRFDALGCRHEGAVARETRARVMVATGRFESAILEARRALEVHKALGTRADLDRAGDLLDEAEERYRRSDQSVRHAQILLELSLALGAVHDVDTLLPMAIDAVSELVGAERGLVALYDADGTLEQAVVRNLEWDGPDSPLPVSESVVAESLREQRPVLVQDAVDSGAIWDRTSVALLGLRSIVCIPLMHEKRALGVLYLDSRRLVATDLDAEVELLSGVAQLLALSVVNARLYAAETTRARRLTDSADALREGLDALADAADAVAVAEGAAARLGLSERMGQLVERLSGIVDALLTDGDATD